MAEKKKYTVRVFEVHFVDVPVEAENAEAAKDLVRDMVKTGDHADAGELEYSHVMDSVSWDVSTDGQVVRSQGFSAGVSV